METIDELRHKLHAQTGRLGWKELERHFARGSVIKVAGGLDLIEVAASMARDDKAAVESWLTSGRIARAETEDVLAWHERQAMFWAVVAAPWVLVQEIESSSDD